MWAAGANRWNNIAHKSMNVSSKIKPLRENWTKESIDEHRMIKLSTDPEYLYPTERKILWKSHDLAPSLQKICWHAL